MNIPKHSIKIKSHWNRTIHSPENSCSPQPWGCIIPGPENARVHNHNKTSRLILMWIISYHHELFHELFHAIMIGFFHPPCHSSRIIHDSSPIWFIQISGATNGHPSSGCWTCWQRQFDHWTTPPASLRPAECLTTGLSGQGQCLKMLENGLYILYITSCFPKIVVIYEGKWSYNILQV